jgi:phage-related minor tail protein
MPSIADLFVGLFLEKGAEGKLRAEVTKTAEKAGDEAGLTMGQRLGRGAAKGLKTGITAIGAAAAVGLGLATKGVIELEEVTASFRAETGATEEEAKKAGKAINAMAGRNLQPLTEIGKTMERVHTDLGLTGDAAEATTEQFLKFGRATKQDASVAVERFDDILDAFDLTAAESQGLMDKLVKSHQEYGGSIDANEQALAAMAPQLRALNLNVDDGIGLLNLFASTGLDAAAAQKALNAAVKNLPTGTTFQDFVKELQSIEDPTKRAQRAIQVFGARAGVGLANALAPGRGGLEEFTISTEEAAGATAEAAEAMDSAFGARVQLALRKFTTAIVGLGAEFGPVVTGLASLGTLGATLGINLRGAFSALGRSGPVRAAVTAAGLAIGAIHGAAIAAGTKLAAVLAALWGTVAGSSVVTAAATRAGAVAGSAWVTGAVGAVTGAAATVGAAVAGLGTAMGAGIGFALTAALNEVIKKPLQDAVNTIAATLFGTDAQKLASDQAKIFGERGAGAVRLGFEKGLHAAAKPIADAASDAVAAAKGPVDAAAKKAANPLKLAFESKARDAAQAAVDMKNAILDTLRKAKDEFLTAAQEAADATYDPIILKGELAAVAIALAEAKADKNLLSGNANKKAIAEARVAELTKQEELLRAKLLTVGVGIAADGTKNADELTKNWQKELSSSQPEVKKAAFEALSGLYTVQNQAKIDAGKAGSAAAIAYGDKLEGERTGLGRKAGRLVAPVNTALKTVAANASIWGANIPKNLIAAMNSYLAKVREASRKLGEAASVGIEILSNAPEGPLSRLTEFGPNLVKTFVRGMLGQLRTAAAASAQVGSALASGLPTTLAAPGVALPRTDFRAPTAGLGVPAMAMAGSGVAAGGDTYNIQVPVVQNPRTDTPEEMARHLRRISDLGYLGGTKKRDD